MDIRTYLVNAAIAAALGAGTNELAIIAILRYILPRKKSEIAHRIRDVIATDLISPDKIREKVDDPRVSVLLEQNLDAAFAEFLARDLPSPDELMEGHLAEADAMQARGVSSLLDEFARRVAEPDFAGEVLRPFLAERWQALRQRTPRSLLTKQADNLPDFARSWILSLADSQPLRDSLRRSLERWLGNRIEGSANAAEVLSPGLVAAAEEELAVSQAPAIIHQLTDILREPGVRGIISGGIMEAIRGQLRGQGLMGGIKGAFVNAMGVREDIEGICRRLPDALEASFNQPINRERLTLALRYAVRKGMNRELHDDFRSPARRGQLIDMALDGLWRGEAFAKAADKAGRFVERSLGDTLEETLGRLGAEDSVDSVLDEVTARCLRILSHPATREMAARQLGEMLAAWRARPLGRLERFVNEDTRRRLSAAAAEEARTLIRARLEDFTEKAGLWDIVTSSIEGYDDRELSNLVQQLARSELRWVTILGGVIGAMVGLLQTALYAYGVL